MVLKALGAIRGIFAYVLIVGMFFMSGLIATAPVSAAAGINQQINFQGRLYNAAGATVPDGFYNIQFTIWCDGDGVVGGGGGDPGSCNGDVDDEHLLWTENHLNNNTQGVRVVNGFMSVQLGSITAFGSSVNWNWDELYVTMNVGTTNPSCTPFSNCGGDGAMSPMKRLTASPYALNAGQLGGLSASGFIQNVSPAASQQTANINILSGAATGVAAAQIQTVASATAPVLILKGGATPGAGADLLQLQDSSAAVLARVNSSGNLFVASSIDTQTAVPLVLGNTNATQITLDENVVVSAAKSMTVTSGATSLTGASGGSSTAVAVATGAASNKGMTISGAASQTADLQQFQDNNGAVLSKTDANANQTTYGVNHTFSNLATPAFTTSSTGTNFYYKITATNAQGETVGSASLGMANNTSALAWNQVNGATGYKIYRNTSDSFTAGSLLLTTITNGATVGYTDSGSATGAGLPPTIPTGSKLVLQGWEGQNTNAVLQVQSSAGTTLAAINAAGTIYTGTTSAIANTQLTVVSGTATRSGLVVRGASGQSADQLQIRDNNDNVNAAFSATGNQLTLGRIAGSGTVTAGALVFGDGTTDNFGATLNTTTLTNNRTISLPDAGGTICLQGATACGFAAASGSANYIQNQSAGQQATSNFWISGIGRADTSFTTPLLDTATAVALNIGTTNATSINFNQSAILAAGESLTVTGGNTASRPGSPTEGMVYYDSTTDQLITYANGKWQGDRSTATKIVAASNSSQAIKDGADYVADGTGDEVQINDALTAAAGGKVYLAEGTYTIANSISIPNNTTLAGAGAGTIITIANGLNANFSAIVNTDTSTGTGVVVQDLRLDGNKANQSGTNIGMAGIDFLGMGNANGASTRPGARIANIQSNNWFRNGTNSNCQLGVGICLRTSASSTLTNNTMVGNDSRGIYLASDAHMTVTGNLVHGSIGTHGIDLITVNNSAVTGNVVEGSGGSGIIVESSGSVLNTVTGNTVRNNGTGINIFGSAARNTVSGNTVENNSAAGVNIAGNNNVVSGNKLHGNGSTTTNDGIELATADYNTIENNDITDTSCTSNCYAINITDSASDKNYLSGNRFSGSAANAATINDLGTNTIYSNQQTNSTTDASDISDFRFRGSANSATAFQIQNAANTSNLLTADTTNDRLVVGSSTDLESNGGSINSPYGGFGRYDNLLSKSEEFDHADWTKTGATVPATNITAPNSTATADSLLSDSNGESVSQTSGTAPTNDNYTFSLWLKTASGTQNADLRIDGATSGTGTAKTVTVTTSWQRFSVTQNTNGFTGNIKPMIFPGGTGGQGTVHAWGAQLVKASTPLAYTYTGDEAVNDLTHGAVVNGHIRSVGPNAGLTLQAVDTTDNYYTLYSSAGELTFYGGLNIRATIEAGGQFGLGHNMTGPTAQLHVQQGDSDTAGDILKVTDSTSGGIGTIDVLTVANEGATTFRNRTNSASAFQVQRSNADPLLVADTTNNRLVVGNATASAGTDTTLLVIDSAATGNAPTGVNGGMFYDTTLNKFRCYQNGGWVDCINTAAGSTTLQNAYDFGAAGDQVVQLDGTQDSLIFRNPSSGGSDSTYILSVQQLATGATDCGGGVCGGLDIQSAGTGNILRVRDTTATAVDVFTIADLGHANFRNQTDGTSAFNIEEDGGGNLFTVDTTNSRVGINLGGSNTPTLASGVGGLEVQGALRLSGGGGSTNVDLFTTPQGSNVDTKINIPLYNVGQFSQVLAFGLNSGSHAQSRAISVFDNRSAGDNQPPIAVFSPDENTLIGLSWDGQNSVGYLKTNGTDHLGIKTNGTVRATFDTSNAVYFGNGVTAAAPNNFTISGTGSSTTAVAGGNVTVQGGNATVGNANGGNLVLTGGTGVGTGVKGLTVLDTPSFTTATAQNFTADAAITAANVNSSGAVLLTSNQAGWTATLNDPTITTAGKILYVTNSGSFDMTLSINGGGAGNLIALKPNTSATMVWNGVDWTAAGASSSTDLQSAYNNTLTSAGGAELVLNPTGGNADGLTVRNNATTPIIGALFEAQTSIGSNLMSVNNNATEYATNGGAETQGASASTFPANTWDTTTGGTVDRYTTAGDNIATGQASVRVQTTASNHGARNRISTTLTSSLEYTVSLAVRGATNFSTLDVRYSPDGTTSGTTQCATAQTVTEGQWSRITCNFVASGTITSSNSMLIRQTDGTARTFYIDNLSINVNASATYVADGSVDAALGSNWTAFGSLDALTRDTSIIYDTSGSVNVDTPNNADRGVRNNLSITPAPSTQYLVTFFARSSNAFSDIRVRYSRDGGTNFVSCVDYNTQTVSTSSFTEITCLFTTDGTTATDPDLIIDQPTASNRNFWVDAVSVTLNTNRANNIQIGGANKGGPTTLFTLDRSNVAPIAANNEAYLGSMYYDTSTGRIQCYEADGWGACGAQPDNIVNLNPEYSGAVLNGSGTGTMTADFCSDDTALQVNTSLCETGEAKNFYRWTSPQATQQTYSIYVTYQLPASFKGFASDDTVQLTARASSTTNAAVTYEMFKSTGSAVTKCGSGETTVVTTANTWQTVGINGNEATGCSFTASSAGNFVIFKINTKANSSANAYVGTLSFTTTGR